MPTEEHTSAGGIAYRQNGAQIEIALISVGESHRWQLPKGTVDQDESHEATALREVREEAGIETELVQPIKRIEYWFYGSSRSGKRTRYHKFVYFYLLRYLSGDVNDHDHEVNEARWVEIGQAQEILAFESEKKLVAQAQQMIQKADGVR